MPSQQVPFQTETRSARRRREEQEALQASQTAASSSINRRGTSSNQTPRNRSQIPFHIETRSARRLREAQEALQATTTVASSSTNHPGTSSNQTLQTPSRGSARAPSTTSRRGNANANGSNTQGSTSAQGGAAGGSRSSRAGRGTGRGHPASGGNGRGGHTASGQASDSNEAAANEAAANEAVSQPPERTNSPVEMLEDFGNTFEQNLFLDEPRESSMNSNTDLHDFYPPLAPPRGPARTFNPLNPFNTPPRPSHSTSTTTDTHTRTTLAPYQSDPLLLDTNLCIHPRCPVRHAHHRGRYQHRAPQHIPRACHPRWGFSDPPPAVWRAWHRVCSHVIPESRDREMVDGFSVAHRLWSLEEE